MRACGGPFSAPQFIAARIKWAESLAGWTARDDIVSQRRVCRKKNKGTGTQKKFSSRVSSSFYFGRWRNRRTRFSPRSRSRSRECLGVAWHRSNCWILAWIYQTPCARHRTRPSFGATFPIRLTPIIPVNRAGKWKTIALLRQITREAPVHGFGNRKSILSCSKVPFCVEGFQRGFKCSIYIIILIKLIFR